MMDPLYASWPIPLRTRAGPERRQVGSMDAFSFGQPARGAQAFRQVWAPALDLFDSDRTDDAPPAPLTLAKLLGLVALLTVLAGVLLGTVGRAAIEAF
jgi:hypothetical protein